MIIDMSCYPTKIVDLAWRHNGAPFTGERLLKMMDGPFYVNGKPRRIDKAFIQPPQGNTIYTDGIADKPGVAGIREYMAYTVELCEKYPDRFLGCFVYNPRYGVQNGADEIERHAKEHGFKMVQLQANMHAYRPDRALDWLRPAMKKCAGSRPAGQSAYRRRTVLHSDRILSNHPRVPVGQFHLGAFWRADGGRLLLRALSDGA